MRVPRIGGVYTPKVRKNNASLYHRKLSDLPSGKTKVNKLVSFGFSIAYYLKKYNTLPADIKKILNPKDAIDMFREMEFVANGIVKRNSIGQGADSKVYSNPWLKGYHFLVLNNPSDAKLNSETVYSKVNHLGDAVWADADDKRIQLLNL